MRRAEIQLLLFGSGGLPRARAPRRTMRVIDAGEDFAGTDIVRLKCWACGFETDWTPERPEDRRGRPCPRCNRDGNA